MRTVNKLFRHLLLVTCMLTGIMYGQTTVLSESMGIVTTTTTISTISAHEAANRFDNDAQTMTGTADVRNSSASSGYTGASGAANIFVTNTSGRFFQIEGINTTSFSGLQLSFGMHKSTNASNGSDFVVEVSSDGVNYTALSYGPLPTGSGTAIWRKVTATGTIPATSNLRIRFRQTATTTQYRVDDVSLSGFSCTASFTADDLTTFCEGEDVMLTASSGVSYLWSNGATTQSINVNTSGTFWVTVTDTNNCVATSDSVRVLVYPAPVISVSVSDDTICEGDTVILNARLFASDLIISEYVEGTGNEKYVEIFNGTGVTVNLSDYHYQAFHNGALSPTIDFALSGTLADGNVIVLKNGSATLYSGGVVAAGVQHNGNDAIAIYNTVSGEFADIFGVIGHNPGVQWDASGGYTTLNSTLRRNDNVYAGITVNPNLSGTTGFTTLNTEWAQSSTNDISGLGSHSLSCNFDWSFGTTPSSGCTVEAVPSATEIYTATGVFANGCSRDEEVTVVVETCLERRSVNLSGTNIPSGINGSAYPNPFNDATTIGFHVPSDNNLVLVDVIDINGKPVTNLYKGQMDAGDYRINWNGSHASGGRATSGIYICRIMIGAEITTVRLLLQ